MKDLTAEQILKKTFEHLDEMVDEKGQERRKQGHNDSNDSDGECNSKRHGLRKCIAEEENNEQNE